MSRLHTYPRVGSRTHLERSLSYVVVDTGELEPPWNQNRGREPDGKHRCPTPMGFRPEDRAMSESYL
jgi:hypothetical protein